MSRNLCQRNCGRCGGAVEITGPTDKFETRRPRSPYLEEFRGMLVADAECAICGALYLAWLTGPPSWPRNVAAELAHGFVDLSYRASFNDEPAPEDVPPWATPRDLFRAAERQIARIVERREKNLAGNIVAENLYQYATGMMYGATEVLRAMNEAKTRESGRSVSEPLEAKPRLSAAAAVAPLLGEPDITISGRPACPAYRHRGHAAPHHNGNVGAWREDEPARQQDDPDFGRAVREREAWRRDLPDALARGPGRGAEFSQDDGSYVVNILPDPPKGEEKP